MNFSPQERVLIWVLASLLGLIPATIAHRKGRSFAFWWFYGAMIFVVALLHSLWIRPVVKTPSYQPPAPAQIPEPTLPEGIKKCVSCSQLIDALSMKCPVCKAAQT